MRGAEGQDIRQIARSAISSDLCEGEMFAGVLDVEGAAEHEEGEAAGMKKPATD